MSGGALWGEFLIRALATGFVVVFIAWVAARLGPLIGGILVGLPIVLAPGFFFLVRDEPVAFVTVTASSALFSLAATQLFLGAYVMVAPRLQPGAAILAAAAAWGLMALPFSLLPRQPFIGAALFAVTTVAMRLIGRRFLRTAPASGSGTRWRLLILRGVAAGLLVGCVTLAANALGPSLAGMLIGFPIGFCVILLSLSIDHGAAIAAQTAYTGLMGVASLAAFCLVLAVAIPVMAPWTAYSISLAASVVTTASLGLIVRQRNRLR